MSARMNRNAGAPPTGLWSAPVDGPSVARGARVPRGEAVASLLWAVHRSRHSRRGAEMHRGLVCRALGTARMIFRAHSVPAVVAVAS